MDRALKDPSHDPIPETFRYIPLTRILVGSYQRNVDEQQVQKLVRNWDEDSCEPITVNSVMQKDGEWYRVIDGQTRVEARRFRNDDRILARILHLDSIEDEARVFSQINSKRRAMTHYQLYHAMLIAGDEQVHHIDQITTAAGLRIANTGIKGGLVCTRALERTYRRFGPDVLSEALQTISAVWNGERDSLRGGLIEGIGVFIAIAGDRLDRKRLRSKLATITVSEIIRQAKAYSARPTISIEHMAKAIAFFYNHKTTTHRLDIDAELAAFAKKALTKEDLERIHPAGQSPAQKPSSKPAPQSAPAVRKTAPQTPPREGNLREVPPDREQAWHWASLAAEVLARIESRTASIPSIARQLCSKKNWRYPDSSERRAAFHNRIRYGIQTAGAPLGLSVNGQMVTMVRE